MSTKEPYKFELETEVINDFEEVAKVISTEDEPFDTDVWLESKMEQFVKKQKESFAWKNYNQSK